MFQKLKDLLRPKPIWVRGFKVGDQVKVVNKSSVFPAYVEVARKLPQKEQLFWDYRGFPEMLHPFKITRFMPHEINYEGHCVIVIRDMLTDQIYLIDEYGIEMFR